MDIVAEILIKRHKFITLNDRNPETLYIGHHEMSEIKNNSIIRVIKNSLFSDGERLKFAGMTVFEVDADVHFTLG